MVQRPSRRCKQSFASWRHGRPGHTTLYAARPTFLSQLDCSPRPDVVADIIHRLLSKAVIRPHSNSKRRVTYSLSFIS
jgi:hypothetical protein